MERKTILVVSPSLAIGGREKIALNTIRCFDELGYRAVLVVFRRCETEYPFDGERIDLEEPPRPGTAGRIRAQLVWARKLRRLRQQYRAECVYSLVEAANIANVLSGRSGGAKTVISLHDNAELRSGFVPGWVYRHADRVVCIAQDMQYRLKQLYPGKLLAFHECGLIPKPDDFFSENCAWSWIMPWHGTNLMSNHPDRIKEVYQDERMITLDRLPGF